MQKLQEIARVSKPILKKHGVAKAGIFGSVARGEARKRSDVDILIQFKGRKKSYFDLIRLEEELEAKLKRKVDIITYRSINHLLRKRILKEEVRIL